MFSLRADRRNHAISKAAWTGVSPEPPPDVRTDEQIRAGLRAQWEAVQAGRRGRALGVPPGFLAVVMWEAGPGFRQKRCASRASCRRTPAGGTGTSRPAKGRSTWRSCRSQRGRSSERLPVSHVPYGASRSRLHRHLAPRLSRESLLTLAEVADGRGRHGPVLSDVCRRVTCTGPYAPSSDADA